MGRLVLAGLLCAAFAGSAWGGTRKVRIETDPPGATVYLNDVADGPVCDQTPCDITAPVGSTTIIIRLDKYEALIEQLDVPKGRSRLSSKWKLRGALATLIVDEPKGATIFVDDEEQGTVPTNIQVSAEAHHVVVKMGTKTAFDDVIEVATGDEFKVIPQTVAFRDGTTGEEGTGSGGGGGGGGETGTTDTGITATTTPAPRAQYLTVGLAFDVGFRHVTYDNAMTPNLREESEGGQVIAGPAVELFPTRILGMSRLRGLSLFARAQFNVHGQALEATNLMGDVTTYWGSLEFSLRHRWAIGSAFAVEASAGYVRDQMQFNASDGDDIAIVPDALYQSLRIGGRGFLVFDKADIYFAVENRIVLSGGAIASRFDSANATGLRGAVGAVIKLGPITARVEGSVLHYSWTFGYDGNADVAQADGATDSVKLLSFLLGYSY
jgi:hypothetical protein